MEALKNHVSGAWGGILLMNGGEEESKGRKIVTEGESGW